MSKKTLTLLIIIILLALGGAYYWFFVRVPSISINTYSGQNGSSGNGIFASFGENSTSKNNTQSTSSSSSSSNSINTSVLAVPPLREISTTPVGGMISSSTPSTTILRWIDRGTGHIYQAYSDNTNTNEISDMTVPMIYQSYWNTAANSFIFNSLSEDSDTVTSYYSTLTPITASAGSSTTPYSLSGSPLPAGTLAIAVSPNLGKSGNQVFTLVKDDNGGAAGFISNFNGSNKSQIFDTPLTEVNVQWPSSNILALTTKGTAFGSGFLYFVNPKSGIFTKIIGGINGLSTLVNADASEVLYSYANSSGDGIKTSVYNTITGQNQDLPFNTLAEKCVWSTLQKNELYCAIPLKIDSGSYPDAWYQGSVSFNDSIWEVNTLNGDVHKLIDITKTAGQSVDAENLQLSPREDFLYFINKKDLSLWSFNLNAI